MVPYPVFSALKSFPKINGTVGHMCRLDWPSKQAEQAWYVLLLFILFFIPGVVMIIAYGLISRELYRGIQFELSQNKETTGSTPVTQPLSLPNAKSRWSVVTYRS
ncbi:hypothetical protein CHARACLAT_018108 [Characodon lateralis]|uniref:Uncharacterized protein n=1 Tax=Characodon lateralis TaxID=208331 RepID=A0ABU7E1I9_9TELE|nr:hypothetical protein [Characodon lateralis]